MYKFQFIRQWRDTLGVLVDYSSVCKDFDIRHQTMCLIVRYANKIVDLKDRCQRRSAQTKNIGICVRNRERDIL